MSSFADHAVSHFVGWLETPSQMNEITRVFPLEFMFTRAGKPNFSYLNSILPVFLHLFGLLKTPCILPSFDGSHTMGLDWTRA